MLERDVIQPALASSSDARLRAAALALRLDAAPGPALRAALSERLRAIDERVASYTGWVSPPDCARVERPAPGQWLVRVPLYTDVTDEAFVRDFTKAVEGWWHVRTGDEEFRVELAVETVTPEQLYCGRRSGGKDSKAVCAPPAAGEEIDLEAHVARFPEGGAVLTTGATTLKLTGPRALVLGPHDTAPRVLAHEFGHILGMLDAYFRGYRDLGADGFEVTELADYTDIMGAPGAGPVLPRHFERFIAASVRASLNLSLDFYRQQRFSDSIDAARRALVIDPDFAEAYDNIAAASAALGRWDDAILAANQAIRLKPDFQLAKNNLAWAQGEKARPDANPPPK